MVVSYGADAVDVGAVVLRGWRVKIGNSKEWRRRPGSNTYCAYGHVLWWEALEIPIRRLVWVLETFIRQEREARAVETRGHYDHISFD